MAEQSRGRKASSPKQIPKAGWKDILVRTKGEVGRDNLSIVSAGVAFYALLAIFPAIGAMVSIYGLVADPGEIQQQISALSGVLPEQAMSILQNQLSRVASGAGGALSLGALFGILLALWSAAKGMKALITGLNIVYDEEDERGFVKLNAIALLLTLGAIIFAIIALGFIVAVPALLGTVGLSDVARILTRILRWPLLAVFVIIGLALLYRYAPDRSKPKFRWVSWGAVVATLLWILVSVLFSLYVTYAGSYNETYGSIGAVIILLMWFYITAFAVLFGAELNAEMEHQTGRDTTSGSPEPMGARGAHVADTRGESRESTKGT
ncbi:MAG: YihY/virulence factor BrkB family protein [Desulfovibrionales bacterium]